MNVNSSIRLDFLIPAFVVMLAAVGGIVKGRVNGAMRSSWRGWGLSVAPSLVLLLLFYSLALHMRQSLGSWPASIGERGFPGPLLLHATITIHYFIALLLGTLFVWPVAFLVCALVRRWRGWVVYLSVHALAFAVCAGCMELAPTPFLYWWHD